jgi:hypothetical protein
MLMYDSLYEQARERQREMLRMAVISRRLKEIDGEDHPSLADRLTRARSLFLSILA